MYGNSVSTFGALLQFHHSCEEIVYFSRDFSTTFIQCIQHNEVTSSQQVLYRCFIMQDLNRSTDIQYPLIRHFFNFSTTAVKRLSTFQGILVLLSFNTSNIMKSHRANRCYTDAFIMRDLNRSTDIQYPLIRHFFNFSTTAVNR